MLIYIDVAFLLNFVLDFGLLIVSGLVLHKKIRIIRLISGGVIGAFYHTLSLFFSIDNVILSLVLAFFQIFVAYKDSRLNLTIVYIISATITAGVMNAFDKNDFLYGVLFLLTIFTIPILARILYLKIAISKLERKVHIKVGEKSITLTGLIDSGNELNVAVIGKRQATILLGENELLNMIEKREGNYILIPCITVNGQSTIPVFKPDLFTVDGKAVMIDVAVTEEAIDKVLLPSNFIIKECSDVKETV